MFDFLQIHSIEDISRPKILSAADALEEEVNSGSENSDNETENRTRLFKKRKTEPKKKEVTKRGPRLLSIVLTDGHIFCKAIEYQSINCLTVNTPIGAKLLISGPLEIYTAVMFLTTSNVKLLGGTIPVDTSSANERTNPPLRTLFRQTSNNL